jgi:hypothetical protein
MMCDALKSLRVIERRATREAGILKKLNLKTEKDRSVLRQRPFSTR